MPAFQHSIDLGYSYIETDVHLSADGVLYAFHDAGLKARTGLDANIADLDAAQIDELLVDGRAAVPRLDEVMISWPTAKLNIDAKSDAAVLPLIDSVRAHDALDRVCLGSFSDRRIKKFREEFDHAVCTSMGKLEASHLYLAGLGFADPKHLRAACAQVPPKQSIITFANARLINLAHEHDIQVHFWTINDAPGVETLIALGADGIMTDQPRMLREVLIDNKLWLREGALA